MSSRRPILVFVLVFLPLYVLLTIPWPGFREGYHTAFIGAARIFFACSPGGAMVRIGPLERGGVPEDTAMDIEHPQTGGAQLKIKSSEVAFLPTVLALALVLATPVSWKRRAIGFVVAFALVNLFIMLRLAIMAMYTHSVLTASTAGMPPGSWAKPIAAAVELIGVGQGFSCIAAVLIWIIAIIRRDDVRAVLERHRSQASGGPVADR